MAINGAELRLFERDLHRLVDVLHLRERRPFEPVATVRDIAEAAGMSWGAAHHDFPSKEALVLAHYERIQKDAPVRRDVSQSCGSGQPHLGAR